MGFYGNKFYGGVTSNNIECPVIKRDKKFYIVKIPADVKKEAITAMNIAVNKIKELQSSDEYKTLLKNLMLDNYITEKEQKAKLLGFKELYVFEHTPGFVLSASIGSYSNDIDKGMFNQKDSEGNSIIKLTKNLIKDLKSNTDITKLPHFYKIEDAGNICFNIQILFKIYPKGKEEFTEVKDYKKW